MNTRATKTNEKHSPYRVGAKPAAIGFFGGNQCFITDTHKVIGWPLFSFASVLKDGK